MQVNQGSKFIDTCLLVWFSWDKTACSVLAHARVLEDGMAEEATLPAYFPRVAKECKAVSKEFFDCFSNESKYAPGLVSVLMLPPMFRFMS